MRKKKKEEDEKLKEKPRHCRNRGKVTNMLFPNVHNAACIYWYFLGRCIVSVSKTWFAIFAFNPTAPFSLDAARRKPFTNFYGVFFKKKNSS